MTRLRVITRTRITTRHFSCFIRVHINAEWSCNWDSLITNPLRINFNRWHEASYRCHIISHMILVTDSKRARSIFKLSFTKNRSPSFSWRLREYISTDRLKTTV
ncbi:hypothetical protein HanXRQr2_Chr07g0297711 [Helianthus annuus]|uniref:Uncharacterized protein n=1 Tax=Helianthus annuus TaxID=4232 RepID=A0A9K3NG00_HELAN|nr:hypothetical protein HanXRQr2_Chr07g0297711 [Helianthus annuus]KAJ0904945.1 hypothetical protein HanPSC8_Chr07g0288221 [Helianthus annuus]